MATARVWDTGGVGMDSKKKPDQPIPGAQVRRNWRRWFTHRDRNRCSPVLPGGGGAKAGRVSVERLTAVTDRSATGISEDGLPKDHPHLLPRPWPLSTTLRPWSVVRTLNVTAYRIWPFFCFTFSPRDCVPSPKPRLCSLCINQKVRFRKQVSPPIEGPGLRR